MKRIALLSVYCFGVFLHVPAQTGEKLSNRKASHIGFQSLNQLGLLEGEKGSAFQLQTINGIKYQSWFAGAGIGIDYYKFRTIPLFFDLRKDLQAKDRTAFIFGDIGINFPWVKTDDQELWLGKTEYSNGLYYEMGMGYKITIRKNDALLLSAGYSFKQVTEKRYGVLYCPFIGPCQQGLIEKLDYGLKRVNFKLGWSF